MAADPERRAICLGLHSAPLPWSARRTGLHMPPSAPYTSPFSLAFPTSRREASPDMSRRKRHQRSVGHDSPGGDRRRNCRAAAACGRPVRRMAPARNVVLVQGLFTDGSCWLDVFFRLQASALNVVAVQNPLTTLRESVDAVRRALACMTAPLRWSATPLPERSSPRLVARRMSRPSSILPAGSRMPGTTTPPWQSASRSRPRPPASSSTAPRGANVPLAPARVCMR